MLPDIATIDLQDRHGREISNDSEDDSLIDQLEKSEDEINSNSSDYLETIN